MKNYFLVLLSVLVITFSCEKSDVETSQQQPTVEQDRHKIASDLATLAAKHPKLQEELQRLAIEMAKTGYYELEFFLGLEMDERLKLSENETTTLRKLLTDANGGDGAILERMTQRDPYLSLLLGNFGESDVFSGRIYIDEGQEFLDANQKVSYYTSAGKFSQKVDVNPNEKLFVLRTSEGYVRPDELLSISEKVHIGSVKETPVFIYSGLMFELGSNQRNWCCDCGETFANYGLCEWYCATYYGCTGGAPPYTPPACDQPCERDCKSGKDFIWRFRTTNDYDNGLFQGKGEFYPVAIWADDANITYNAQTGTYALVGNAISGVKKGITSAVSDDNVWFTPNYELITWEAEGDGERIKILWYEQDDGAITTLNFSLSTKIKFLGQEITANGGVTRQIFSGDDWVGESIVEYCDGLLANTTHDAGGGLTFQMKKND